MKRTVDYQCDNTIDVLNNSPTTHIVNNNMSNNFHVFTGNIGGHFINFWQFGSLIDSRQHNICQDNNSVQSVGSGLHHNKVT